MSSSTITLNGQSVTLVAMPASPGLRAVDWSADDAVSLVVSPFTGQTQGQQWPGGDMLSGTATLPPLSLAQADAWISFLLELRGMANAFLLGDPLKATPRGTPAGSPAVDNSGAGGNAAMSQALTTKGWTASTSGLLLPGDYLQIGYRLHRVLDQVNSDGSGKATIAIFPSLREIPADSGAVITTNPVGLFRLAKSKRAWSYDYTRMTQLGFPFQEYR